jgi:hypothetical protein
MLKCNFREVTEYPILNNQEKTKLGRYHQTTFSKIEKGKYVIAVYIDGEFEEFLKENKEENLINECIEYLNSLKKKITKKNKNPKCIYGNLSNYISFVKRNKNGKIYLESLLITDEPKNSYFWGEAKERGELKKKIRVK